MQNFISHQIIADLERHSSRLEKESIIEEVAKAGHDEFFEGCRFALDPMITFGLKQVPEKTDSDMLISTNGMTWDAFAIAVTGFITRQITGNTARNLVNHLMLSSTKEQWNGWYRRILIKDLRCGVSEKTLNKVVEKKWPRYAVPIFSCQLAHDSANHESKVSGQKLIEVKLDGVRVLTVVYPDGRVDQFSRNGKELVNFPHIKEQIATAFKDEEEPMVLDGEIMSSSFQDLMKQVHRKDNVEAGDAILNLFDIIPLADFEKGFWNCSQTERSKKVTNWVHDRQHLMPNVSVLGQELVDLNTQEGQELFKKINSQAIAGGYEGIMIKDPDAPYECKRSHAWLKLKPFIEVSLEVTHVEEGTGKNIGRLGAFICSGMDDGKTITVNVGSGFSDDQRINFWNNRHQLLNQVVEVRADAVTQNQDGSYSLRFPRFLRFRGFDPGEKI